MKINRVLAESKGLTEDTITAIEEIYKKLNQYLTRPNIHFDSKEKAVTVIEGMEYTLQSLWGFPLDSDYHRYWKEIDGCLCPKMDNEDPIYFGQRVINSQCPYHGND